MVTRAAHGHEHGSPLRFAFNLYGGVKLRSFGKLHRSRDAGAEAKAEAVYPGASVLFKAGLEACERFLLKRRCPLPAPRCPLPSTFFGFYWFFVSFWFSVFCWRRRRRCPKQPATILFGNHFCCTYRKHKKRGQAEQEKGGRGVERVEEKRKSRLGIGISSHC